MLLFLNQALTVDPHHPVAQRRADQVLQRILGQDAFLGYLDENEALYEVQTGFNLVAQVPKDRAVPETYPPKNPSPLRSAFRWLGLAVLGLPLAGFGTFVALAVAILYALRANMQLSNPADQVRIAVILGAAIFLGSLAFVLIALLILHI